MGRAVRIEFSGAIYHITSRGISGQDIFLESHDFEDFLARLDEAAKRYEWLVYAYCLMPNHYHLLLETKHPNLSKGMRHLNGAYCQAFNRRHVRVGHLLQGRYHSILVERESYLLEVSRYIVLNPVRAGLVRSPENWKWSSFEATAGGSASLEALATETILGCFGTELDKCRSAYRRFVHEGLGKLSPLLDVRNQLILGSESYVKKLTPLFKEKRLLKHFPRIQRYATRPPLNRLLAPGSHGHVDPEQIRSAAEEHGYTLKEIAHYLGMHRTALARLIKPGGNR